MVGATYIEYTASQNASGQDLFTYMVEDRFGARSTASVVVGIASAPGTNQNPVGEEDTVTVLPGRHIAADVLTNDSDPDGDPVTLTGNGLEAAAELTAPAAPGTVIVYYGVSDGRGGTAVGTLKVTVRTDAPKLPPIARDDRVTFAETLGKTAVYVPVLKNDEDADGVAAELAISFPQRIASLLNSKQMVGDDEQYAVAMALMARELGIPARVVMGFYPDPKKPQGSGAVELTGDDVHAWVEVAFAGAGWVPFNPTPSEDNVPIPPDPQPKSKPEPQVLQPPPPPQAPAELPPDSAPDAQDAEQNQPGLWGVLGPILLAIGIGLIPVAVLVLPLVLIAWLKLRRRNIRAGTGSPTDRISGGWSEVMSAAADLGTPVPAGATLRENAANLAEAFPASGTTMVLLAHRADEAVFAAGQPSDDQIRAFWADVDTSVQEMTRSVGFWRRQRARFSLRSLASPADGGLLGQLRKGASSLLSSVASTVTPLFSSLGSRIARRK
ncbi:hypothetical protein GU243_10895 [Pseudarthrobacter psychrotolerans]|uniref:Transglutaminase-like domain-containing protein n=1 Tax=Pseudarthrobacter psychrotolerans TaxID=2697569 RepID=A0A6P1NIJ1_9MICC|nr:hypothetical protein GU243_10895 [Pseudarthrobacter psychrotolerans]